MFGFFKRKKQNEKNNKLFTEEFKIFRLPLESGFITKKEIKVGKSLEASPFVITTNDEVVVFEEKGLGNVSERFNDFSNNADKKKIDEFFLLNNKKTKNIINGIYDKDDSDNTLNSNDNISVSTNQNNKDNNEAKNNVNFIISVAEDDENNFDNDSKKDENIKTDDADFPFRSKDYVLPNPDFLEFNDVDYSVEKEWNIKHIQIINDTLSQFNVPGKVVSFSKGPTLTRYEIKLEQGVNVNKVTSIENNLKMNLAVSDLTIQAPIPGKPSVGLVLPNDVMEMVLLGNIVNNKEFIYSNKKLLTAIGLDIDRNNVYLDLASMPHGLVAGTTGSGKSICINTIIISLLLKNNPDELKLMLIDPKRVELQEFNELPHLITPVITDSRVASSGLKWAVNEMERRYQLLADSKVKDIANYNNVNRNKLPYIVIIIDELADLLMESAQDVESSIQRLTQKARAAGIHLLVATQRPTTDVIKGTIKANIPTRLAFKVTNHVDSQTILDGPGANSLIGKGDLLLKVGDKTIRCQAAYISQEEISNITNYIRSQRKFVPMFTHDNLKSMPTDIDELLFTIAREYIRDNNISINKIQSRFGTGFTRAQAIVEQLISLGIVSENQSGGRGREFIVDEDGLEKIIGDFTNGLR